MTRILSILALIASCAGSPAYALGGEEARKLALHGLVGYVGAASITGMGYAFTSEDRWPVISGIVLTTAAMYAVEWNQPHHGEMPDYFVAMYLPFMGSAAVALSRYALIQEMDKRARAEIRMNELTHYRDASTDITRPYLEGAR